MTLLKILGTRRWDAATGQFVEEDLPPEAMNPYRSIYYHINPMWAHWQRRVCWNFAGPGNDAWNQETTGFGLRCFFEIL